jgi:hypothetical protein
MTEKSSTSTDCIIGPYKRMYATRKQHNLRADDRLRAVTGHTHAGNIRDYVTVACN